MVLNLIYSNGWKSLESPCDTNSNSNTGDNFRNCSFYDYRYFLREVENGVIQPLHGETSGEVPEWLEGSLLQNGPGKYTFGNSVATHWFDGSACIQKFTVKGGKVTYTYQLLNTETLKKNTKANKHIVSEFGTRGQPDPCHTLFQRFQAIFTPFVSDNCNISIYPIDGGLYAMTETIKMHRLDKDEISSVGTVDLRHHFEILSQSAHPHVCSDGSIYNIGLTKSNRGVGYAIYEIPNEQGKGLQKSRIVAKVPSTWPFNPGYMHSFGITESYFILIEQPITISIKTIMLEPLLGTRFCDAIKWQQLPVNWHVVHRITGERKTYTSDIFFYFHTVNQYEEDGHIVMDVCTYNNTDAFNYFFIEYMKGKHSHETFKNLLSGRPFRFVIPLNTEGSGNLVNLSSSNASAQKGEGGVVHLIPETLCEELCELPRINQDYLANKYKYFYALCLDSKIKATGKVMKIDVEKKEKIFEWYEDYTSPSEPIFIPNPQPTSEDDGVLILSLLSAKKQDLVSLVLLDARNFKEISRTVFNTPEPVPKSLHGWFS